MGVYIKKLQAKKVEAIFAMLGLHIEDGDIIEVKEPHGDLIDRTKLQNISHPYHLHNGDTAVAMIDIEHAPTVIESEE